MKALVKAYNQLPDSIQFILYILGLGLVVWFSEEQGWIDAAGTDMTVHEVHEAIEVTETEGEDA